MNEILNGLPWNKKLKILRDSKGWTQEEASEKCFTNKKGFWNWETGKAYPRKNSRVAIAKAFGIAEEEIFNSVIK